MTVKELQRVLSKYEGDTQVSICGQYDNPITDAFDIVKIVYVSGSNNIDDNGLYIMTDEE